MRTIRWAAREGNESTAGIVTGRSRPLWNAANSHAPSSWRTATIVCSKRRDFGSSVRQGTSTEAVARTTATRTDRAYHCYADSGAAPAWDIPVGTDGLGVERTTLSRNTLSGS